MTRIVILFAMLVFQALRAARIDSRGRGLLLVLLFSVGGQTICPAEVLRYHTLVVDGQNKIIPWFTPTTNAFHNYLVKCWSWALAVPNDVNGLPISFLYSSWYPGNPPMAITSGENDVGEKIPHWVESARLYYQYTGDKAPLDYVKRLVDYSLAHGQTPTNHAWPDFPVGTANAGDTEFRGYSGVWALWDCHVDLAAHIGFSMCQMHQMYGDTKYLDKAIHVADVLASHIVPGTASSSPWPYVINSQDGANKSVYAASWTGALRLFDFLVKGNQGNVSNYASARSTLKSWLLTYPMQNGNWVDGHSDLKINGTYNWSATCASDMCLYLSAQPGWDPNLLTDMPKLLKWIEDNFVNVSTPDRLPGQYYGAYVPGEQTSFMYRMGYQAARIGAQYAQWYALSGDAAYKDRAYRCLSYNTYMMQDNGQSSDGPTDNVGWWWSDCYGEAPMVYYYALGAIPEWAPTNQNHLLRSSSVVTSVSYASNSVTYTTFDYRSDETLRLAFTPAAVIVNSALLPERGDLAQPGWVFTASNGVLRILHDLGTNVQVLAVGQPPTITTGSLPNGVSNVAYSATLTVSGGIPPYVWSVAGGSLPPGLALNSDGAITGAPTATGAFNFTAQVSDASNPAQTATKPLSVTVAGMPVSIAVTPVGPSIPTGNSQQFAASGTYSDGSAKDLTTQTTWTSSNPAVATINASGLATAASVGTTTISAALGGVSGSSTLTVQTPPVTVTTASLSNATVGMAYTTTITATGGTPPYTWSLAVGALPPGLSLNAASGVIAGTPSAAGTFNFTLQVADASNPLQTATRLLNISVVNSAGTIGNRNEGTTADYLWDSGSWINACRFQAASNMVVSTMGAKVGAISGGYKCAIYTDKSGSANALLGGTAEVRNPANGWNVFPLSSAVTLTNGQYYWLAIWSDNASAKVYYSDTGGTLRWGQYNYGVWPNPIATTGGSSLDYCIFARGGAVPTLSSVAVTPTNGVLLTGSSVQFTATGIYSDSSTQDITSQATWTSSNTAAATVNASGLATGVSAGKTTISAALSGVSGGSTLTVQVPPVTITATVMPNGAVRVAYTATLQASGGTAPYRWSVAGGILPPGLTLNASSGVITGTPTNAGTFGFTIALSDVGNPVQAASRSFTIAIANSVGILGNTNNGTSTDYLWSSGSWINAGRFQTTSNATVSAIQARVVAIPGQYKCAIYADSGGQPGRLLSPSAEVGSPGTGWQAFPLTSLLVLTNGHYYWLAIWSDDANARVYYSTNGGTLRWGRYDYGAWPDPIITTGGGNLNYCIYATNATPPLVMTTSNLPSATVGVAYSAQLVATGGVAPYTWILVPNAAAPAGLTLSANGVLSGVPSAAGQFSLWVVVTDSASTMISQEMHLGIARLSLTLGVLRQTGAEIETLGFRLTISANLPGTYLIQRTTDFHAWEPVRQVAYTNGVVAVMDSNVVGAQARFYRAVRQ